MKLGSGGTGRIPRLVLLLVALVLVVPPVATVVLGSFRDGRTLGTGTFTLENFSSILSNRDLIEALGWTLAFAVATSVLTIALAVVVAWVSERTNAPGRSLVNVTLVAAFAVPHFVIAMGWLLVLGPNTGLVNYWLTKLFGDGATQFDLFTLKGMVIVETFSLLPLLVLLIRPSFRAMNPELEEAAKIFGANERRTLRKITVPMARPAILAAGFLCLVLTIQAFEVPTLIGVRSGISVLSVEIYREVNGPIPNYGIASAFSVSLIVLTLAGLTFYRRSTRHADRFAQMTGKAYRARRIDLGAWKWLAALVNVGMFVITLAPIAILAWASLFERYMGPSPADNPLTLTMYRQVLDDPIAIDAAVNTFLLGLAGAAIVVGFTLVAAWFVLRRPGPITGAADHVITVPLVLPGIVLALALISIFLSLPGPAVRHVRRHPRRVRAQLPPVRHAVQRRGPLERAPRVGGGRRHLRQPAIHDFPQDRRTPDASVDHRRRAVHPARELPSALARGAAGRTRKRAGRAAPVRHVGTRLDQPGRGLRVAHRLRGVGRPRNRARDQPSPAARGNGGACRQ